MTEVLVPFVNSLVVLDLEGDRLFAKYYDGRTKVEQVAHESMLYKKTKSVSAKSEAEVLLVDQEVIVFKSGIECKFFISGPVEENELILVGVLDGIFDTVSTLLKGQVDKRTMMENLELILLTIDEVIDHGQIMELDALAVVSRVLMKASEANNSQTIGDLSISQALGLARDQFLKTLSATSAAGGGGGSGSM
mmetsp:Transcript_18270/g.30637  ORF Transcript_18270/g.30637 Transcript_18270/m.30637 type:complete len:193 (+) Transcript_18270:100-678(+)|eukprot:CAMPEP_0174979286 /NCGR_PEP_ID=MMETSP0004_2-20121128/14688_1 /TAXON_ID=420556 /ORGANISM="Ochromonas sp., Strain CCMP1393" /LENGTH=192 /DNA_ID=CAMNT_0016230779 /DNA_START=90 /DNA_END=668 /DNA_ORIENTATION=+